ncbi:hypothetical protein VPH35_113196 [Triticum aestivum]
MDESNSRIAACLNPPTITEVYLVKRNNSTTAGAETSKGHAVLVSICFTHPPALSYVCIHCPDLQHANFAAEPRVVRSEKQFFLLHLPLNWSTRLVRRSSEYFLYQAIPGRPTLSSIPDPPGRSFLVARDLGIHCCGNSGEYILAGLCPSRDDAQGGYELHLYSSVLRAWTRKPAYLEKPPIREQLPVASHKVIPLGGSLLGWVDLWRGIIVCDVVSDKTVHLWFLLLPGLIPGNEVDRHLCPWVIRDITCINGSLKLVEIELISLPQKNKEEEGISAAYLPDKTCDDSSFVRQNNDLDSTEPHKLIGWRSVIWKRLLSDDGWRRGCLVHGDDILVVNQHHSALLAGLGDNTAGNSSIMTLLPSFPTLSINGDGVVHINCLVRLDIKKAQMISIDMGNKTLKTMVPCLAGELDDHCPHFPSVLSKYLSNTPALRLILRASNSGTVTENQQLRSCPKNVIDMPNRALDAYPQSVHASHSVNVTRNGCPGSQA